MSPQNGFILLPFSFLTLLIKFTGAMTPVFFLLVDIFQNKSFNDANKVSSIPGAVLILFWSFSILMPLRGGVFFGIKALLSLGAVPFVFMVEEVVVDDELVVEGGK